MTASKNNDADVYSIYNRAAQIKGAGYIASEKIFPAETIGWKGLKQPSNYNDAHKNAVSEYLLKAINHRHGYHVFYFTILNGYHVLTLVVNSLNPCDKKYQIYDQLRNRSEKSFSNIDNDFLELIVNNWPYAAGLNDGTASTKFAIWKMQRK